MTTIPLPSPADDERPDAVGDPIPDAPERPATDPMPPPSDDHSHASDVTAYDDDTADHSDTPTASQPAPSDTASATPTPSQPAPSDAASATPTTSPQWLKGPAVWPLTVGVLGLLVLVVAWLVAATDVTFNWSVLGPALVVGVGMAFVLLGLLGLRRQRSR